LGRADERHEHQAREHDEQPMSLTSDSRSIANISPDRMLRLFEVTRLLAVTADADLLLRRIAEAACAMIGCERASIFLYDSQADQLWTKIALQTSEIRVPSNMGIVGHVFQTNVLLHVPEAYNDPRFNREPDQRTGFVTRNLLTAPMPDLDGKPVGVIQAVNKKDGSFSATDETMLELLAGQAGVAIQRYNLQQAAIEAVALRREMELAKAVQQALIPRQPPRVPGINVAGYTKAASITGGDCYDLWQTSDGRLGIFVGDATGHGIGPAMVISQTRTLIRSMCDTRNGGSGSSSRAADPRELLCCANARLSQDLETGSFVTAFVGFLSADGTLDWCSAGHGPILIRRRPGEAFEAFDAVAPPLGVVDTLNPDAFAPTRLEVGGSVCIISDGIPEAFAPSGDLFGVARLTETLAQRTGDDAIAAVQDAVREWQNGDEPKDDQTMVIATRSAV
jgi:phosphoserine phosphatase RsbU/P